MSSPLIIRMQKADVGYVVELCAKILPKNSILSNQGAPKSLQTFDSLIGICQLDFELTAMVLMNKKVVLIMEFFFSKTEGCPYWPGLTDLTLIKWILLLIGSRESKKKEGIFYQKSPGGFRKKTRWRSVDKHVVFYHLIERRSRLWEMVHEFFMKRKINQTNWIFRGLTLTYRFRLGIVKIIAQKPSILMEVGINFL